MDVVIKRHRAAAAFIDRSRDLVPALARAVRELVAERDAARAAQQEAEQGARALREVVEDEADRCFKCRGTGIAGGWRDGCESEDGKFPQHWHDDKDEQGHPVPCDRPCHAALAFDAGKRAVEEAARLRKITNNAAAIRHCVPGSKLFAIGWQLICGLLDAAPPTGAGK